MTLPVEALDKERCRENSLIKGVKYRRAPMGEYTILEQTFPVKSKSGMIYPYRIIGEATMTPDKNIRVLKCTRGLTTEVVLVQTSILDQVRTQRASKQTVATLIGGPDVDDQILYTFHQYAYADMGIQAFEVGQTLNVKSQVTDSIHGQMKVIEKFGSYAVGVITEISDTIADGDSLIVPTVTP